MIKKETYFNSNNIQDQSGCLLDEVRKKVGIHSLELNPDRAALLVLDMQRYFLEPESHAFVPSALAIIPNVRRLQQIFLNTNLPVVQTRHLNTVDNAGIMKTWWKDLIPPALPISDIENELKESRTKIIEKNRYDAFFRTDLESFLRNQNISQLVITGVMTHLCCETTARSAFMRDFEVFFVIDATATYTLDFHRATLLNLAHGFSDLMLSCDIMDASKNHEKQE